MACHIIKIVKTIVSSNYCFYNSLLRPKSLSMPYSCRAYLSTAALPCKVGRDEYDRTDIENCSTALKKKNPAVEILLSIRRTWPCQGRLAAVVPLHDKKRHQGLACAFAYNALGLPIRLTDYWQMIALGKQHYRACEFGVKTVVLSACGKCVRQTELVECGLNSLIR